ncbi:Na+/H+ antiporter NhaA [Enterorhabdus sp. P55]|uniref:Na+/H+ antiporter NhaA n=1 Tax=Enterorhabdus sp. P55 TaxID=2304571 RepID=UPI001371AE9D|nr:Na+/H+ antiporter NhaA [Enterorhabdus sp. P55]NBI32670.1 Na+/H+ antiporter NhaA [Enterorhabdus sp. P55]
MERTNKEQDEKATQASGDADARTDEAAVSQALFIREVQGHQRRYRKLIHLTHSSTKAAGAMLVAAVVALIVANTGAHEAFLEFWHMPVVVGIGPVVGEMSMAHVINDIFMAVFFLLVGLEIKYEMTVGELTNIRQAALPIIAAVGGVLMPIVLYSLFNGGNPETAHGWGVPTATDIAFALGIMALLGNRVPNGVRVFLSTLAVADDIIAILVIAIFYGQSPSLLWLAAAAVVFALLMVMNRAHVYSLFPYLAVGVMLWFCVFMSGVHSTIAGVLLAFSIPSGSRVNLRSFLQWSDDEVQKARKVFEPDTPVIAQDEYMKTVSNLSQVARQVIPPATRLEHKLYPWVYFGVLPLFALTNADVAISGDLGAMLSSPVLLGVFFGLVLGKPIGIMLFSFVTVKLKVASLPQNVNWKHMLGAAILGGVGFTMAIFVANLAFPEAIMVSEAKLGILAASLVAGVVGFLFLLGQAKAAEARGVAYVTAYSDDLHPQTASVEVDRAGEELLAALDDEELERELEARLQGGQGVAEIVVELPREDGGDTADPQIAEAEAAAAVALRDEALCREERDVAGTSGGSR